MLSVTDHGNSQSVSISVKSSDLRIQTDVWNYDDGSLNFGLSLYTADIEILHTLIAELQEGARKMEANRKSN